MEQDQPKKHGRKLSNKSFLRGKMLRSHNKRVHGASSSTKAKRKLDDGDTGLDGNSYGLRENPRKSWKFSGSQQKEGAAFQEIVECKVCGKGFGSPKSLHGHMRHHSEQERRAVRSKHFQEKKTIPCEDCGREFSTQKSFSNHAMAHLKQIEVSSELRANSSNLVLTTVTDTENVNIARKKRSSRMRYKIHTDSSFSSLNESDSGFEIEQDVQEVAVCLIMLSRGEERFGGFPLLYQKKRTKDTEDGDVSDGDEPIKTKRPREEKVDSCALQSEIKEESCSKNDFRCRICNKVLPSYQALGGHQTIHRPMKRHTALNIDDFHKHVPAETPTEVETASKGIELERVQDSMELEMDEITLKSCESKKDEEYKCPICFKTFRSGQALGGHKSKAHFSKTLAVKQEVPDVCDVIDINLPYTLDAEENHDDSSHPWWAASEGNHEPLVLV